jgi:hypothetical protein
MSKIEASLHIKIRLVVETKAPALAIVRNHRGYTGFPDLQDNHNPRKHTSLNTTGHYRVALSSEYSQYQPRRVRSNSSEYIFGTSSASQRSA